MPVAADRLQPFPHQRIRGPNALLKNWQGIPDTVCNKGDAAGI
jgi:hypothetical protein